MKLGINATFLNERPTGLGIFTGEICRYISKDNLDTTIFSPIPVDGVSSAQIKEVPSVIKGSLKFKNNLYRAIYINTILPLQCRSKKLEVLFCPMAEFPFVPLVPLVVNIHDLHPLRFPEQFGRAAAYFRFSLKLLKKTVRRVTVISEFVKKELMLTANIPEERIDVIQNGYNKKLFYPQNPETKEAFLRKYSLPGNYLLAVGNFFPYKNLITLINAFLRIKDKIKQSLVIVGRREFSPESLPINQRILYMDYVQVDDLPKFYSYADIFIHPSLSEGFGLTPLEAMACGTPVISSNAGALPEVVGEAGILFDPRDVSSLSELLLKVIDDHKLKTELVEKGFRQAGKFSWEKTAWGILRSCERAVKEGG